MSDRKSGRGQKTAIIVGASRGLGLGLAREFARRDWQVTATARNAATAAQLAEAVVASEGRIAIDEVDISRPESVDALANGLAGLPRMRCRQAGSIPSPF